MPLRPRLQLLLLSLLLVASAARGWQAVDDRGVVAGGAARPLRIVSLLPSLTETVCALGACERLVGVDRYSDWPASVARLPKLGGGIDPQIEAIVALKPDLVLIATSARAGERLRSLGLTVLALEPKRYEDVQRVMAVIGSVLGLPASTAEKLWAQMQFDVAKHALPASLPGSAPKLRVYFEVNAAPYGAGEASFMGETLQRIGADNIIPAALGAFPKLSSEFVVRANPDVIMLGRDGEVAHQTDSVGSLAKRPGWQSITAIKTRRVCRFTADESNVLVRAGPRMAEGARLMADCLRR
jgi:iron complex transport system substrate-binding protein